MQKYENNSATQFAKEKLLKYDFVNEYLPGKIDMDAMNEVSTYAGNEQKK